MHEEQNIFLCNLSIYRAFQSLLHTKRRGFCGYGMLEKDKIINRDAKKRMIVLTLNKFDISPLFYIIT